MHCSFPPRSCRGGRLQDLFVEDPPKLLHRANERLFIYDVTLSFFLLSARRPTKVYRFTTFEKGLKSSQQSFETGESTSSA